MAALAGLGEVLRSSVETRGLPGASLAVLHDGEVHEAAAGVLNLRTGVEVTTDSIFQIGSITKVYTATLVMQLVEAGLVDLDAPVRTYLPAFRVLDDAASASITIRQLLTHTSGFDGGDHFFDGGPADDNLERYLESLAALRQITPPGAYWSYNNAGFSVLGRVLEVVCGQTYETILRERLFEPAGMEHSVTSAEEALLFRAAAGHQIGPDGLRLVKRWGLNRSAGPAGTIVASAADVIAFARIHLEDGHAILSPASVKAMQQEQVRFPGGEAGIGLGWMVGDVEGVRVVSHNGGTIGQASFLITVPDRQFAIALLTNGPSGGLVWQDIAQHVGTELGLPTRASLLPSPPETPSTLDLSKYVGTYERRAVRTTMSLENDRLMMTMEYLDIEYDLTPPPPMPITPVDEQTFVVVGPDGKSAMAVQFLEPDSDGRPQLFFAARMATRVS
ncbi:MAG: hypothetical protein V7636_215 [Actinomycetota bacterium]|jgi:CubicO group peptidase (beta-lactamase class C family)